MNWLKAVNIILLQWFFIRLTRCTQKRIMEFDLLEASTMLDGSMSVGGIVKKTEIWQWYSIQFWILPSTGWKNNFIYLTKKPCFFKVSKAHVIN